MTAAQAEQFKFKAMIKAQNYAAANLGEKYINQLLIINKMDKIINKEATRKELTKKFFNCEISKAEFILEMKKNNKI